MELDILSMEGINKLSANCQLDRVVPLCAARIQEWPKQLSSDAAWEPDTFQSETDYVVNLSEEEVSEIRTAVHHFNSEYPMS